jgi:hypothetical protein
MRNPEPVPRVSLRSRPNYRQLKIEGGAFLSTPALANHGSGNATGLSIRFAE